MLGQPALTGAQPSAIGFVLSLHGTWQVKGHSVKLGQPLFPGDLLVLEPGVRFDTARDLPWTIAVMFLDNTTQALSCGSVDTCAPGLAIPPSLADSRSPLTRLEDAFRRILENPNRYASLLSRGDTSAESNLPDAVAKLDAGRILLGPVLRALAPGRYRLHFVPVRQIGSAERSEAVIDVDWNRGDLISATPADLPPGLYAVTLSGLDRLGQRIGRDAWVLVAAGSSYDSSRAAYDAAVSRAATWRTRVPAQDIDRFLRAYLAALAEPR